MGELRDLSAKVGRRSGTRVAYSLLTTTGVVAVAVAASAVPAVGGTVIPRIPRIDPVNTTPRVVDDSVVGEAGVRQLRQVGQLMYAGGHFNRVLSATRTGSYT